MCIYLILFFTVWIRRPFLKILYSSLIDVLHVIRQYRELLDDLPAVRHEKRVGKYVSFVCAFMFVWYSSFASRFERNFKANPMSFVKAFRVAGTP